MRAYVCVRVRARERERTAEIHYLSSTMDIYHPVVLFKFCTKRGASPLLTPPCVADASFIVGSSVKREVEEKRRPVDRSVSRSEGVGKEGCKRRQEILLRPPSSFPSLLSILRSGAFGQIHTDTEVSPQGETDQGRSDPLGTNGFPFSFFPLCIFFL